MNLFLSAAFALLSFFALPQQASDAYTAVNHPTFTSANLIVMEDENMLLTTTDSSNGPITNIEVVTPLSVTVMDVNGCGAQSCETDLSSLSSGSYTVFVTTHSSYAFSGEITVE